MSVRFFIFSVAFFVIAAVVAEAKTIWETQNQTPPPAITQVSDL